MSVNIIKLLSVCLVSFVSVCCANDQMSIAEQVSVITALQNHFRSGCLFFVLSDTSLPRGLRQQEKYTEVKRFMENEAYTSSSALLIDLHSLRTIKCQRNRPFLVILHCELDMRHAMQLVFSNLRVSDFIWLMFLDTNTSLNKFFSGINIPFDCEFLVAQQESDVVITVNEVYRLAENLTLKTQRFGEWPSYSGLADSQLDFCKRRSSLEGVDLEVGYIEWRLGKEEHLISIGFIGAMWEILEEEMNFKSHFWKTQSSGARDKNGLWNGVVGLLNGGALQASNIPFVMTSERQLVVDFTYPLLSIRTNIIIKKPGTYDLRWNTFLQPFSLKLRMSVGIVVAVLIVSLTVLQLLRLPYFPAKRENVGSMNSTFLIITTFVQQGCSAFPKPAPVRVLLLTSYLTAVVLLVSYSAAFITCLTIPKSWFPFKTFEEFLKDGSYKLGMMRNTAQSAYFNNSKDPLMRQIYDKMVAPYEHSMPKDDVEGMENLCKIHKYALATNTYNLINQQFIPNCTIALVPQAFFPSSISFAVAQNSPYKRLFNHKIQLLRRGGVLQRNYKTFWFDVFENKEAPHISITVREVAPILCVLVVGVVSAMVLLALECWIHRTSEYVNSRKTATSAK